MTSLKRGVLLINLGTPDGNDVKSVKYYLKEFLNDPRVVDLSFFARWPLVNLLIVPFRQKKTAQAYQQIWTKSGSPLLINTLKLRKALAQALGDDFKVAIGMRYGKPSIQSGLEKLKDCQSLDILPLFPQYSSAATGSAVERVRLLLHKRWNFPAIHIQNQFYDDPLFINAYAEIIKNSVNFKTTDLIVFSYHGLPERHIDKSGCHATCDRINPCPQIQSENFYCYRAQCYQTTRLLAEKLSLPERQYMVSFQSRLGHTPWIQPYTDKILPSLAEKDVKNLAVVCPSFVADCLETLEEINIRAREQWRSLGGEEFSFVPCLNDSALWVEALTSMLGAPSTLPR